MAEPWRKILRTCGRAAQLSVWVVMSMSVPLVLSSLPQCQNQEGKHSLKIKSFGQTIPGTSGTQIVWDILDPGRGISRKETLCKAPLSIVLAREWPRCPAIWVETSRDLLHLGRLEKLYARTTFTGLVFHSLQKASAGSSHSPCDCLKMSMLRRSMSGMRMDIFA